MRSVCLFLLIFRRLHGTKLKQNKQTRPHNPKAKAKTPTFYPVIRKEPRLRYSMFVFTLSETFVYVFYFWIQQKKRVWVSTLFVRGNWSLCELSGTSWGYGIGNCKGDLKRDLVSQFLSSKEVQISIPSYQCLCRGRFPSWEQKEQKLWNRGRIQLFLAN